MIQIRKAEEAFKSANARYGITLDELAASHLTVPSHVQYGYQFTVRASESYVAVAVPTRSKDISMSLYLDQSGTIREKLSLANRYESAMQANEPRFQQ